MISTSTEYVDVTEKFFSAVSLMDNGTIEKTTQFDMLEGARALEMGNIRLDTGLLDFNKEELAFDASKGLPLSSVTAIMNKLLILYMTWLKGSSLSVSLLSSRHVLGFLQNYKKNAQLKKSTFVDPRLQPDTHEPVNDIESHLVNTVLRGFVIGICKLAGFTLAVATNVLYDEEDLVTRSMNFNFLQQVSPQIVLAEIEEAELWLQKKSQLNSHEAFNAAVNQLKLIKALVRLEFVPHMEVKFFQEPSPWGLPNKDATLETIESLKSMTLVDVPAPAFSKFVQLDCDNKHLPSENVAISQTEAYDGFKDLVESIHRIIWQFTLIKNTSQLETYLKFEVGITLASSANALARGIFQLFFIRDDKSIAGSNESVLSIMTSCLENFSLCGNSIMNPKQWNIQGSKDVESTSTDCFNKMAELLNDLESASIHKFGSHGNNRCRQRQTNNRLIVLWDSLHFNAESIETELFGYGVGDKLSPTVNDQSAFGICSYVYYQKLDNMIDVALSGFEQDLYKLHEASLMYWFVSILCSEAYQLITTRVVEINKGKLAAIQNLPKKIKGTKAGPKKEALKAEYASSKEKLAPVLAENVTYLEKYLGLSQLSMLHATKAISASISIMRCLHDSNQRSGSLVSDERLYSLRMKSWSSVGVPEVPSYEAYVASFLSIQSIRSLPAAEKRERIKPHVRAALGMLEKAISCCKETCYNLENEQVVKDRTRVGDDRTAWKWSAELQKTCEAYKSQLTQITVKCDQEYTIKQTPGYLPYFPLYQVVAKQQEL